MRIGFTSLSATTSKLISHSRRVVVNNQILRSIILPSFLPSTSTPTATFWNRALSTRKQTSKVVKSRWLSSRAKLMALERERRSIGFEREDERRRVAKSMKWEMEMENGMAGLGLGEIVGMESDSKVFENSVKIEVSLDSSPPVVVEVVKKAAKAPSIALMGVSMLGSESTRFPFSFSKLTSFRRSRRNVQTLSVSSNPTQLVRRIVLIR